MADVEARPLTEQWAYVDGFGDAGTHLPDRQIGVSWLRPDDELRPIRGMFSILAVLREGVPIGWLSACDLEDDGGDPYQHAADWMTRTSYVVRDTVKARPSC